MRALFICSAAAILPLVLSACGGGSGGQSGVSSTPPPPPPVQGSFQIPPPATKPTAENFDTSEFRQSEAASQTNAIGAYQNGSSGKGVKIGFVDTGINISLSEFAGKIDPASRSVTGSGSLDDPYGHGTAVASIAAAARDQSGMHGVAFNSTIVMINAAHGCPENCSFSSSDIAEGIDAARLAGAKVINLSIGGGELSSVNAAVARAAAAGIVVIVGAGNDSSANPTGFASGTASSGNGAVIIAGALGTGQLGSVSYDQLVSYSNRAGSHQSSYLAAPGYLIHAVHSNGLVDYYSGSSFAAPVIAGAAALLIEAFPTLTGKQVVEILFRTADDLGLAGLDSVYGHGRLNIGRAFQPVGQTAMAGLATPVSTFDNGTTPAAAGDALSKGSMPAVILDDYSRAFELNLAATLKSPGIQPLLGRMVAVGTRTSSVDAGSLSLAVALRGSVHERVTRTATLFAEEHTADAKILATLAAARISRSLSVAIGNGYAARSLEQKLVGDGPDGSMLTRSDGGDFGFEMTNPTSFAARHKLGAFGFTASAETGSAVVQEGIDRTPIYRLLGLTLDRALPRGRLSLKLSHLFERETILGGKLGPAFGTSRATTVFFDANLTRGFGRGWSMGAHARRGWTRFVAGSFTTGAYSFELAKSGVRTLDDELSVRVSQPLRVSGGGFNFSLPTHYDYETGSTTFDVRRLSLTPTGREIAFETRYATRLGAGLLAANLFGRRSPGHRSAGSADVGGAIRFDLKF